MIIFLGDYFIIILSEFTFIIFQEKEEKSSQATAPTVEAKAKDVSVFFSFLLYCHRSKNIIMFTLDLDLDHLDLLLFGI